MAIPIVHRDVFHDVLPVDHKRLDYLRGNASNLTGYAETHGQWLQSTKALVAEKHGERKGNRVLHVMDLGPGHGNHFADLQRFRGVKLYAFGPHKPSKAPKGVVHLPHFIEETVMPDSFDVIQSRHGAVQHSANRAIALENALNSLKAGGHLVMHADELSDLPFELRYHQKGSKYKLENELKDCLAAYRKVGWTQVKTMEDNDSFYLAYGVLQELRRQGFRVPTDEQIALAHAHGGDVIIQRQKANADLSAFYAHGNTRFNPIPIYL